MNENIEEFTAFISKSAPSPWREPEFSGAEYAQKNFGALELYMLMMEFTSSETLFSHFLEQVDYFD